MTRGRVGRSHEAARLQRVESWGTTCAILKESALAARSETNSPIRALDILELIAEEGEIGHAKISERLAIPKSTASSLLKSLHATGFILRGEDRKFSLAPRIMRLSEGFLAHRHWMQPLLPLLERLRNETNETTFLLERRGNLRVVVARCLIREGLSFTIPVGDMSPLNGTAGGHALCRPDEVPLDAQGRPEPKWCNPDGVFYAPSAVVAGVVSFAVALRVPSGVPPLAFALAMPETRLTVASREKIEAALVSLRHEANAAFGT